MKTTQEIRRENLIRLVSGYKSQRKFALSVGIVPSHISQMLSGVRDMGEKVAGRIERSLGMTAGFMSVQRDTIQKPIIEPELQYLPADELKLLTDYRQLSQKHRDMMQELIAEYRVIDQLLKPTPSPKTSPESHSISAPETDLAHSASATIRLLR